MNVSSLAHECGIASSCISTASLIACMSCGISLPISKYKFILAHEDMKNPLPRALQARLEGYNAEEIYDRLPKGLPRQWPTSTGQG